MGNQSEENGGWQYGCLGFFVILCIIGEISNLFDSCNGSSYKTDFSIKSLFSKRAYKTYWNRNMFVIELPYPTKGLVGINEVSWGKVDVDELIEDIYDEIKNSDYSQCLICVSFITKYKNQYGDDVEEKTDLNLIALLSPVEVRKYKNGKYLDGYYNITGRILRTAFGSN